MKVPVIQGVIRRRLLLNYRVDPGLIAAQLPAPFEPKLHGGHAIAGVCLIRLEQIRPHGLPGILGFASENAAHRIAVRWRSDGAEREGVFIPRRDTNSVMNRLAGGRLFPGEHHAAEFEVQENERTIRLTMKARDDEVEIRVAASTADQLPEGSCFSGVQEASAFFEPGSLGYSATGDPHKLHGVTLVTKNWMVEPLAVDSIYSSYFADVSRFPAGSAIFDHALLMRNIDHEWHGNPDLYF